MDPILAALITKLIADIEPLIVAAAAELARLALDKLVEKHGNALSRKE